MKSIGVLGSSRPREGEPDYENARALGRAIGRAKARVVCGGYGGVMEAACRGAAEEGGVAVGVIFESGGPANRWVQETIRVPDLSERLRRLRDLSDAWIFLPRGLGTMLELVWIGECVVKSETLARPMVLLGDFWHHTVETMLKEAAGPGRETLAGGLHWAKTPEEAVELALTPSPRGRGSG